MTAHKCNHESKIQSISTWQKATFACVVVFILLVTAAFAQANKAVEKATEAIEKTSEIAVIKNDVQWIKKHLEQKVPKQ